MYLLIIISSNISIIIIFLTFDDDYLMYSAHMETASDSHYDQTDEIKEMLDAVMDLKATTAPLFLWECPPWHSVAESHTLALSLHC